MWHQTENQAAALDRCTGNLHISWCSIQSVQMMSLHVLGQPGTPSRYFISGLIREQQVLPLPKPARPGNGTHCQPSAGTRSRGPTEGGKGPWQRQGPGNIPPSRHKRSFLRLNTAELFLCNLGTLQRPVEKQSLPRCKS